MILRLMHYIYYVLSPIGYARHIGVTIGNNTMVYRSMEWPTEPYLITIGNHVQLTRGVAIHTHGGQFRKANCARF